MASITPTPLLDSMSPSQRPFAQRAVPCRPQRLRRRVAATGGADTEALLRVPLFPLPSVLHPAQEGTLLVFEPRFLELFRDLQAASGSAPHPPQQPQQQQQRRQLGQFGHLLAPSQAPPALMEAAVGGLPPLGVCASVRRVEQLADGKLQVHYEGARRFRLLSVDTESRAYPLAAATWLDDERELSAQQAVLTDSLEQDVWGLLQQVAKYSQALAGPGESFQLPPSLLRNAPPPLKKRSSVEHLIASGHPAGARIATWQRLGSVYSSGGAKASSSSSSSGGSSSSKPQAADPYQQLAVTLAKGERQERFSFAAAQLLELGVPERLALLQSRDTAARLQFVSSAVGPFLKDLVARASLKQAVQP